MSLSDSQQAATVSIEKATAWVKENLPDLCDGAPAEVSAGEMRIVMGPLRPCSMRRTSPSSSIGDGGPHASTGMSLPRGGQCNSAS